jgi:hypothetical protein
MHICERELPTAAARSCQRRAARAAVDNSLVSAVLASVVWGKFTEPRPVRCACPALIRRAHHSEDERKVGVNRERTAFAAGSGRAVKRRLNLACAGELDDLRRQASSSYPISVQHAYHHVLCGRRQHAYDHVVLSFC